MPAWGRPVINPTQGGELTGARYPMVEVDRVGTSPKAALAGRSQAALGLRPLPVPILGLATNGVGASPKPLISY
jgi:hypothetical protein